MTPATIARTRAAGQGLIARRSGTAVSLVTWLGAVQAQDYPMAKWSVAQRLTGGTVAAVDAAIVEGTILRTHVLRPTWHFVPRDDLRWMQQLTASRVLALVAHSDRQNGVGADLVKKSMRAIAAAIARRGHLTRSEISGVLSRTGVAVSPWLVGQLLIHAELRSIVCSGAPRGKQQTYALLEERAPRSRRLDGDEALAELALRYFRSHGPATLKDFRWWSGLDAVTAARGVAALGRDVERIDRDGRTYIIVARASGSPSRARSIPAHLIQPFDEIVVAYSESRDLVDVSGAARARQWSLLVRGVMVDGQLTGRWSAKGSGRDRGIDLEVLRRLTAAERAAVDRAVTTFRGATSPGAGRTDSVPNQSRSTRTRSRSS